MWSYSRVVTVVAWCVACMTTTAFASVPLTSSGSSRASSSDDKALYRIFLQDGTALVSYGEYARVAGRVVFSVPVALEPTPQLQLVSVADTIVDWTRTEEYAEAVRARRYAEARGEDDFAALSSHVAAALNEVAHTKDPARRLALALEARGNLAEWPKRNYGYRASDVTQLLWLFDDVISQLRSAAGQTRFDLNLYAATTPPSYSDVLPAPDRRATLDNALTAARFAEPGERVSLLRAITGALGPAAAAGSWEAAVRDRAAADLADELRNDRLYVNLAERMTALADRHARRADVRSIQWVIGHVLAEDARLGQRRPQETTALLAALDLRLDDARRLRLARDAWALRRPALQRYRRALEPAVAQFHRVKGWLEDIRALAGPAPALLATLQSRMALVARTLERVKPPVEAEGAHALLATVATMSARAAQTRRNAVQSNDMAVAWDASSAAAGALLMFDSALDEINRLTSPPRSR
jgi:hypothetical protein